MPEERKKGKHLTWEDRHEIQRGLRYHRTFTEIGEIIGCSPDTVSKEIRKHRYHKPVERIRATPNRCKHRDILTAFCMRKSLLQSLLLEKICTGFEIIPNELLLSQEYCGTLCTPRQVTYVYRDQGRGSIEKIPVCPTCKFVLGQESQSICPHCGQWLK